MNEPIEETSQEDKQAALKAFFGSINETNKERAAAAEAALPALDRLVAAMGNRTGQSYHIRELLYSLYNGQQCRLIETLELDWALKKDVCAVILAFGFESAAVTFFYDAMKARMELAGEFGWFIKADAGRTVAA